MIKTLFLLIIFFILLAGAFVEWGLMAMAFSAWMCIVVTGLGLVELQGKGDNNEIQSKV